MSSPLDERLTAARERAGTAGSRSVWRLDRFTAIAAVVAFAHFFSFPARSHPIATDIRYYLYYSAELARGQVLYRDSFDPKGPFAPLLGAALISVGERIGIDPLLAIRLGFQALAGVGAVAAFLLHRHLARGRAAPAYVGLGAYLGLSLVALLPSIGNICKLGLAFGAVLAALFVAQRAWLLAGIAAAIALLDWQIGAVVVIATLVAALSIERGERRAAMTRVVMGVALALAPAALYFAWHDALGDALRATGIAAFAQHTSGWAKRGIAAEAARRWALVNAGCPGQTWLLAAGLVGIPLLAFAILRSRRELAWRPPAIAIGLFHGAIVTLSTWELQGLGDLFALVHSLAFLAGFALILLGDAVATRLALRAGSPRAAVVPFLLLAIVAARPWQPRWSARLATPAVRLGVTLDEQRAVAREVARQLGDRRAAYLGPSEIPFLLGTSSVVPFTVWHASAHAFYAKPGEASAETLLRLLDDAHAEVVVTDHGVPPPAPPNASYRLLDTIGDPARYAVDSYRVP